MNFGSVCSGIEAASVAWHPLGWKAAWLAEIEPFPCAVLAHHYPTVPNLGDMTTIIPRVLLRDVAAPDVFTGGTPCQAFSVAGKRESLADARGNLSLTFCEIANAIDDVRATDGREPCIVVWENVPGVLSTSDNAFGCFLGALAGAGCELQPAGGRWTNAGLVLGPRRAVAWRIIDAQYFGLAQRRRRVFVVASARDGFDPAAVLFEFDGVRRDSAPSREAGKDTAGSTGDGIARCVTAGEAKRQDWETCNMIAHSLRGEGFDASEDGTGRGTPLIPVDCHGVMPTMLNGANTPAGHMARSGHNKDAYIVPVTSIQNALRGEGQNGLGIGGDVMFTLDTASQHAVAFDTTQITSAANYSNPKPGDPCHPLAAGAHPPAVAFTDMRGDNRGPGIKVTGDIANTLHCAKGQSEQQAVAFQPGNLMRGAGAPPSIEAFPTLRTSKGSGRSDQDPCVATGMAVRRLTPMECERLQGFSDGYTAIPWRNKPASECPDGPRYKSLGNSWAVPCARWIGERIQEQIA